MKKVLLGSVISLSAFAVASSACANTITPGFYAKADGIFNMSINKVLSKDEAKVENLKNKGYSSTFGFDAGAGYQINQYVGVNGTVGYYMKHDASLKNKTTQEKTKYPLSSFVTLGNVDVTPYTYEFPNGEAISPFFTAGIGLAHNMPKKTKVNGVEIGEKPKASNAVAWQAGLGVNWELTHNVAANIAWRTLGIGNIYKKADKPANFKNPIGSEFLFGVNYKF